MPEEEFVEEQEQVEGQEEQTAEETVVPAFDAAAERQAIEARVREELEAKYKPAPVASAVQEEEVPDRYADPDAYDAYRDRKTEERIMSRISPLLGRINEDTVINDLSSGLPPESKEYIRKFAPHLNAATMTDLERDLITRAARDYAMEKNPPVARVRAERPYGEQLDTSMSSEERFFLEQGAKFGISEKRFMELKKEIA